MSHSLLFLICGVGLVFLGHDLDVVDCDQLFALYRPEQIVGCVSIVSQQIFL